MRSTLWADVWIDPPPGSKVANIVRNCDFGGGMALNSNNVALIGVAVTAAAGIVGYMLSQAADRRDKRIELYAEALRAVKDLEELPFRITRRADSSGETRAALGAQISDSFVLLGFYRAWTQIDSEVIARAYILLLDQTQREVRPNRQSAWNTSIIRKDSDAHLDERFHTDNKPEWALCIAVIRRELSLWAPLRRHQARRMIDKFETDREIQIEVSTGVNWNPPKWSTEGRRT